MATLTTTYTAPTVLVPASVTLAMTPAEIAQLAKELAPVLAGNINISVPNFPFTAALVAAAQTALASTAVPPNGGTTAPPVTTTVAAPTSGA